MFGKEYLSIFHQKRNFFASLFKKNGGQNLAPQKIYIPSFYLNGGAYKIPPSVHKAFKFLPIPSGVSGPIFLSKDSE